MPNFLTWDDLPEARKAASITAGEALVERVGVYATFEAKPLTDWDLWVLRHGPSDFVQRVESFIAQGCTASEASAYEVQTHNGVAATFNRTVLLIRTAIRRDRAAGIMGPLVQPRKGLKIPKWWEDNYQIVYQSELPWLISAAIQDAFMGHPPFGEKGPWRLP